MSIDVSVAISSKRDVIKCARDVGDRVIGELGRVDFAVVYTTYKIDDEFTEKIAEIIKCPFVGCYTEKIIKDDKLYDGVGILAIKGVKSVTYTSRTMNIKKAGKTLKSVENGTVILLINGYMKNIPKILRGIYNQTSDDFVYAGGCSGRYPEKMSLQFTERGISEFFCAGSIDLKMCTAFDHGWEVMRGPFIITKYSGNRIYELDGKRAFDVYCECVGCSEKTFEVCRRKHPFGFLCQCEKYILRSPYKFYNDGSIEVVSEVPKSSVTAIMTCEIEDVIFAAENAAREAMSRCTNPKFALVFDCVSRMYLLKKKFNEELKIISEIIEVPYLGMLTFGEIVSTERNIVPAFHNKAVVVAAGGR